MTAGDLGRRVAERRQQLGLTTEDVASRTGMSPAYLRMVESSPSPQLSRAALWRLAAALETSVDAISGSGWDAPPGRPGPSRRPSLERLNADECQKLVAPGGVGRFVYVGKEGPVAVPVNFRVLDGDIVFRTDSTATVLAASSGNQVSFEVDHLDEALTEGWSVLLTGGAREVVDPEEIRQVQSLGIAPWAGGERRTFVRLVPRQATGRRIRGTTTGG
jgi:nitroimidazol reductase NimA-like FMN-containing flavoprotein (pyridoxamine 5'-phosphate oxidase superfamily)